MKISNLLTSYRLKGMDPYTDAQGGPLVGHTPVSANLAAANASKLGKRLRSNKEPRATGLPSTPSEPKRKCTRCWSTTAHDYKSCPETVCVCGHSLANGQMICYNYDNHVPDAKFIDKIPTSLAGVLEAYRQGRSSGTSPSGPSQAHPTDRTP